MPTGQMTQAIQHLRRAVLWGDGAGLSDAQLLEHFIERRDEAAFATLVRRHGPMVLGVCRRLLRNYHDADDAFQATFLVLVRKAASIAPKEMVGNWLYGVAYQTALKGRAVAAKRRARERQVPLMPEPETRSQELWHDLQSVLDQELSRLPDKYRVPFVLCDLEGKSYKEAARQLDWPDGTFSVRLARARQMLAKRLTRHGFSITGTALAAVISQNAASACVPPSMVSSAIKAAGLLAAGQVAAAGVVSSEVAALTKGVLKAMLLTKVKTAMAVALTVSIVGLGGGALSYSLWAGEEAGRKGQQEGPPAAGKQADDGASNKPPPIKVKSPEAIIVGNAIASYRDKEANAAQTDKDKLQGVWKLVRLEALGKVFGADKLKQLGDLAIDRNEIHNPDPDAPKFCYLANDDEVLGGYALAVSRWHGKFELDTGKKPKRITITGEGLHGPVKFNGIYSLDGDELRICLSAFGHGTGTERVSEFKTNIRSCLVLTTFKREKLVNAPRKFERFSAGGFQSVRGFESRGVGAADERRFRQYQIECTLVQVDPTGRDLGADGKGKVLAQPVLGVLEGRESNIFSGGQMAVPGDKDNAVEFLDFGVSVRVKVMGLNDGRVRLETALETAEVDTSNQKNVLVRGRSVRSIARVKLGEAIKLVEKDDQGQARHWVRVKVLKEGSITSRTPAKADGNERPTFQEIAQRLGLSDMSQFMFTEAVYGYLENRDAVPSIRNLARDFNMKEIDVYLLIEALRRDAADKAEPKESNGARPQTNGFKSGGDFIFLNSQEYQIPIKANDQQQQLKFWAGFFGH